MFEGRVYDERAVGSGEREAGNDERYSGRLRRDDARR